MLLTSMALLYIWVRITLLEDKLRLLQGEKVAMETVTSQVSLSPIYYLSQVIG